MHNLDALDIASSFRTNSLHKDIAPFLHAFRVQIAADRRLAWYFIARVCDEAIDEH